MLAVADLELDHGPRTDKSATMRMCAVSREVRPTEELIRFVLSPDGTVVPDIKRKLPGRGLWITASRARVAEAVRRNQFSRGFKRDVRAAPALASDTEELLVRSAVEALAMAAKAGRTCVSMRSPLTVSEIDTGAVTQVLQPGDRAASSAPRHISPTIPSPDGGASRGSPAGLRVDRVRP